MKSSETDILPDLQQGHVVVVPFPYSDKFAEKRRPALVVSGDAFNSRTGVVWVAMITSAANTRWEDDIDLGQGATGLTSPSIIRLAKLAAIEPSRILRVAGRIDAKTRNKVLRGMQSILTISVKQD